jgi:hypothetical protein
MNTVMNNNKNKATMKETSKNCVSDYPLSNTESAERGVKRGILRNRNERCAVADVRSSKWKSKSSRWFGKGATSSIVTADVDVPDKVRSGSIWQKCERRGRARHFLQGFLGIKSRSKSKSKSSRQWEKAPLGCWVWLLYLRSSSQGFLRKGVPRVCSNCRGQ